MKIDKKIYVPYCLLSVNHYFHLTTTARLHTTEFGLTTDLEGPQTISIKKKNTEG